MGLELAVVASYAIVVVVFDGMFRLYAAYVH